MRRSEVVIGGAIVAGVVLSASAAFAHPLSEQQWKKQGNAICKSLNKDLDEIGNRVFAGLGKNEQPSEAQAAAFVAEFAPTVKAGVASIAALDEPASLKKGVQQLESAIDDVVTRLQADPTLIVAKTNPFTKPDKIARKLGLKACVG